MVCVDVLFYRFYVVLRPHTKKEKMGAVSAKKKNPPLICETQGQSPKKIRFEFPTRSMLKEKMMERNRKKIDEMVQEVIDALTLFDTTSINPDRHANAVMAFDENAPPELEATLNEKIIIHGMRLRVLGKVVAVCWT
jgi:hypothetical protein